MDVIHGCPSTVIGPSLLLLPVLETVCPNMSRPHLLCLFFQVASRLPLQAFLPMTFTATFAVPVQWQLVIFGHLNRSFYLLTCLLTYQEQSWVVTHPPPTENETERLRNNNYNLHQCLHTHLSNLLHSLRSHSGHLCLWVGQWPSRLMQRRGSVHQSLRGVDLLMTRSIGVSIQLSLSSLESCCFYLLPCRLLACLCNTHWVHKL